MQLRLRLLITYTYHSLAALTSLGSKDGTTSEARMAAHLTTPCVGARPSLLGRSMAVSVCVFLKRRTCDRTSDCRRSEHLPRPDQERRGQERQQPRQLWQCLQRGRRLWDSHHEHRPLPPQPASAAGASVGPYHTARCTCRWRRGGAALGRGAERRGARGAAEAGACEQGGALRGLLGGPGGGAPGTVAAAPCSGGAGKLNLRPARMHVYELAS